MYKNVFKQKLLRDETVFGLFCNIPSPMVVEVLGYAGFDFVIIDAEHGIADFETVENMIRASEVSSIIPITTVAAKNSMARVTSLGFIICRFIRLPIHHYAEHHLPWW